MQAMAPSASALQRESPSAIQAVDDRMAEGGLHPGRRATRKGAWANGQRVRRAKTDLPFPTVADLDRTTPGVLRVPAFATLPWLRAGFSTREDGLTTAYREDLPADRAVKSSRSRPAPTQSPATGELNLGWTAHDTEANVAANRDRFTSRIAGPSPMQLVTVRQFHSGMIRVLHTPNQPHAEPGPSLLQTANGRAVLHGDALLTDAPGLLLGIQTADCVPVLLVDPVRRAVGAFHAGWRGTLARIVERGVGAMQLEFGSKPKNLLAAIGPAIGPCCFAVGEEIRFEFESQFAYASELFFDVYDSDPVRDKYPLLFLTQRAPGHSNLGPQLHLDLFEANRRQLLDAGVKPRNITVAGECTACARLPSGRRKFFSHRAENGFTGRMMSVVGISDGRNQRKK
jgi:YfiH family protein